MHCERSRSTRLVALVAAVAFVACGLACADSRSQRAPQFTERAAAAWINSPPLSIESFRGKVLLIDVWTFDCWNCYRSFPWLKDLEARLAPRGLAVLGIHSPELERERDPRQVAARIREFGITHPVMLDNDFAYWKALSNQFWPAFYVVDKQGVIRGRFVGETHTGDKRARQIEALVEELIAE